MIVDLNSQSTRWGYPETSKDEEALDWMDAESQPWL